MYLAEYSAKSRRVEKKSKKNMNLNIKTDFSLSISFYKIFINFIFIFNTFFIQYIIKIYL